MATGTDPLGTATGGSSLGSSPSLGASASPDAMGDVLNLHGAHGTIIWR